MNYTRATEEVVQLVSEIANKYHRHLDGLKIAVVMKEKATVKGSKTVIATASRPSAAMVPLLSDEYAFVIVIGSDVWHALQADQQAAVVDHELCHCAFDDSGNPTIRLHDYEEFSEVVQRHGFWRKDRGEVMMQQVFELRGVEVGTI